MKRIHENADMSGKTDSSCDGEMLPVLSLFACMSHLVMLSRVSIPHRLSDEGKCPTQICGYDSSNGQQVIVL